MYVFKSKWWYSAYKYKKRFPALKNVSDGSKNVCYEATNSYIHGNAKFDCFFDIQSVQTLFNGLGT